MYTILSLFFFLISSTLGFRIDVGQNRFSKVVVFGDSLSDTGNTYRLSNYTWPIVPPYYQGRFCNGPIWVDRLSTIATTNYAYGGATTDSTLVQGLTRLNTLAVPGVRQQIGMYFNQTPINTIDFVHTLYTVWAGGDDFITNSSIPITTIVTSLMNRVQQLLVAGAQHVLVFNQAPVQAFPSFNVLNETKLLTGITTSANNAIVAGLTSLQQNYTNATIHMFDTNALITNVLSNTSTFTNTVSACWSNYNITAVLQRCNNPNSYVFIDSLHFTTGVHVFIADAVRPFLTYRFSNNTPGCYIRSFP